MKRHDLIVGYCTVCHETYRTTDDMARHRAECQPEPVCTYRRPEGPTCWRGAA